MRKVLLLVVLSFAAWVLTAQEIELKEGWKAKKASEVEADGCVLTKTMPDLSTWMDATVPGTVLTTLINNNKMPDPFFGLNNESIPDVYTEGRDYYTYWFFNKFSTTGLDPLKQVWIEFRGINYFAEVYLNGRRISTDRHEGMFAQEKYNITSYLDPEGINRLAVFVEPPAHPGNPNGGQGGDGMIGRDVTMQFTPGWDWIAPVRDRNTGIWDKVTVEITDNIDIRYIYAKTRVPGERLPGELQDPAFVTFSAQVVNASDKLVEGDLVLSFLGSNSSEKMKLEPHSTTEVVFNEIKQTNPKLWWPNGMGQPSLYSAVMTFQSKEGKVSDREDVTFGFRETGSYFDEKTGSRVFTLNGQKVFIKGANWILSDALLRLSPERYDAEVKMHAEMNMNMIRVWGGSIVERPDFYSACDRYGIMVWQDLWITGDCNGRWPDDMKAESVERRREYPDNHSLFIRSLTDQVLLLRNHPSLYMWCGGNEFPPPPELDARIRQTLQELDDTRYYLNESTSSELLTNTIGGNGDGPYGMKDTKWFFTEKWYPFNPEMGSVGLPNIESLRRIMNEEDLVTPSGNEVNAVWKYHKYLGYDSSLEKYGPVNGIEDFVMKAQLAGYDQYRAMQEGYNSHMWEWYTGVLVWKSQNPWSALKGQFYDCFLDPNATYYGYQHAAAPLHLQYNPVDKGIYIVNAFPKEKKGIKVEARLFDKTGKVLWSSDEEKSVAENTVVKLWDMPSDKSADDLSFLKLKISNIATGVIIDESTYWLAPQGRENELTQLPETQLVAQTIKNQSGKAVVEVVNNGETVAFFVRMKVTGLLSGKMVSPVIFNDNYLVLMPGEKKSVELNMTSLSQEERNQPLVIEFQGFNVAPATVRL